MRPRFILSIAAIFALTLTNAQVEFPPLSPKGTITQVVGNTIIEIEYERPAARGRTIFGELVPFGKVWRTGAGHCTKISFDRPVRIGGKEIDAGKYSIFTIPNSDEWTVILNSDIALYGSYNYDASKDVVRLSTSPQKTLRFYETLTIDIDILPNNARIYVSWENTQIGFDLVTSTDAEMLSYIESDLLTKKEMDSDRYASAAEYLQFQNQNLEDAIVLTQTCIALDPGNGWARRLQMELYEELKQYEKALATVVEALDNTDDPISIESWKGHQDRLNEMLSGQGEKR